jgi:hypothetical protein
MWLMLHDLALCGEEIENLLAKCQIVILEETIIALQADLLIRVTAWLETVILSYTLQLLVTD